MSKVIRALIAYNTTSAINRKIEYIVIHDTGNRSNGADAMANRNYFNGGNRDASADFFVDDNKIVQCTDYKNQYSWHCGDGAGRYGITNRNSVGIEICINEDGNYEQAFSNAIGLVQELMMELGLGIDRVVRHYDASRKNCPQSMNNNGNWSKWNEFKSRVLGQKVESTIVSQPQEQSKSPIQKAKEFVGDRCKELQEKLIALGYNCGGYGADGDFGQGTYNSLIQFQKDNGLSVDGLAGDATFGKLGELINKKNQPKAQSYDFRSLQKLIGAVQDNIAGSETLGKCPLIKYGSNGEVVKWVQNRLNFLGFNCGTADGIFGNMTKQAVISFQQSKGLSSDSIIGNNTWTKLLGL